MLRSILVLLCVLTLGHCSWGMIPQTKFSNHLKVDPSCWQFRSKAELEKTITRWMDNPRASYYIINAAYDRRLAVPAALLYIRNSQRGLNAKRMMIAAYACMVAGGTYSVGVGGTVSSEIPKINSYRFFALSMAEEAMKEHPNSPEMLVFSAACQIESCSGILPPRTEEWEMALRHLRKAQRLDPRWADAYYWYSLALDKYGEYARYGKETGGDSRDPIVLSRAKAPVLRALQLDSGMKASCFRLLGYIAEDRKQYREALSYADSWVQADPIIAKGKVYPMWRRRILRGLNTQSVER